MKFLYSLFFFLLFISCKFNLKSEKKIIHSFITQVILNDKYTYDDLFKFIERKDTSVKIKGDLMLRFIDTNIKFLRKQINNVNSDYQILSDKEAKAQKIDLNFIFTNYSKVYHLIINNNVVTSFVLNKKQIISFSYNIRKGENAPRTPFLLNQQ
jgi:hypothetical protein